MNDIQNAKENRKVTLFENVISRLASIESQQHALSTRALEKTNRINCTSPGLEDKYDERPESIINILNNIMDRMDNNNIILEQVVTELEEAIM